MATAVQVTFDCADPARLADFWATALGYVKPPPPEGFETWPAFLTSVGVPESEWNSRSAAEDPDGKGPRLFFQRVPEGKTVKNRLHLDVRVGERRDAEAERLVAAGATVIEERTDPMGGRWIVMADPEGNEFCLD